MRAILSMQPFDTKEYWMRRSFLLCCLLALGLLLSGTAQAVESVSLKVGIGDPITADAGELGLKFKELVEKRTGGKVKVTLYPNCELGTRPKCCTMCAGACWT